MPNKVRRLKIPEQYLEEIREDVENLERKDREIAGFLLGEYNPSDRSITISEKCDLPNKSTQNDFYTKFKGIVGFPQFVRFQFKFSQHNRKLRENGRENGVVFYHSHPCPLSWSSGDLEGLEIGQKPKDFDHYSQILYKEGIDEFEALNESGDSIEIETL